MIHFSPVAGHDHTEVSRWRPSPHAVRTALIGAAAGVIAFAALTLIADVTRPLPHDAVIVVNAPAEPEE